jgi:hypothetical protein
VSDFAGAGPFDTVRMFQSPARLARGLEPYFARQLAVRSTVSAGVVAAMLLEHGRPVVPTGVCLTCDLRVPVLRSGVAAGHWPHGGGRRFARLARMRPRCYGSGQAAGLIMIVGV